MLLLSDMASATTSDSKNKIILGDHWTPKTKLIGIVDTFNIPLGVHTIVVHKDAVKPFCAAYNKAIESDQLLIFNQLPNAGPSVYFSKCNNIEKRRLRGRPS